MKKMQRTVRDVRKLTRTVAAATATTRKSSELAVASGEVIARRMALGAAAFADPMSADHVEFSRMIPAKMAALSAVAAATIAVRAAGEFALCRTPGEIAAAQSRFVVDWFARAVSQSLALGGLAMSAGGAMLAPVHRAATDNAKRLRR